MTEKKQNEEALRWLNLFDHLRVKVSGYAINNKTFNLGLKKEINKLKSIIKNKQTQL